MPSDLWGTAVTGLVGVAGIGGAILSAGLQRRTQLDQTNLQRSYQREDAARLEKKAAFIKLLEAVDEVRSVTQQLGRSGGPDGKEVGRSVGDTIGRLNIAYNEVELVASEWMGPFIRHVVGLAAMLGPSLGVTRDKGAEISMQLEFARGTLVAAMRQDLLGATSADEVEILRQPDPE